ncbi:hypothetical protein [Microcystis aeruginosa]|uniref:hypothetical protein n=1 Tax=Microcystis aeruginosa TaxID=1126 RepID=UPI001EF0808D|nr:hypothetical protein [Microcystis aeruginosa]
MNNFSDKSFSIYERMIFWRLIFSRFHFLLNYSVFQSAEVQKLWVLGKRQEAKGKGEEKQVYLTSLGNAIDALVVGEDVGS